MNGMRKRYYLSFDMEDPRHREAEALIAGLGCKQRTQRIVETLLAENHFDHMEMVVRQAIREELSNIRPVVESAPPEESCDGVSLNGLPDSLIHALDDM